MDYTLLSAEAYEVIKIILLVVIISFLALIAKRVGDSGSNRPGGGG